MNVYFLSGLGADKRVFRFLKLDDSIQTTYVDWILPEKNEPLNRYAERISGIIDTSRPFILVGLSFGGMMAIEMVKYIQPEKIILISSIASHHEMPLYFKIAGMLKLNMLVPSFMYTKLNFLASWVFGVKDKKDKILLKEIMAISDIRFTRWAIDKILNWKTDKPEIKIVRIHGSKDKLFPARKLNADYVIKKGGHFMIVRNANEISAILNAEIAKSNNQESD